MEALLLICKCHSTDHQLIFQFEENREYSQVYMEVHLNKRPLLSRIKYAIKYIFGYQSRYGAFDEFLVNKKDVEKFEKIGYWG